MCKPKGYFSVNQRNCFKESIQHQLFVEPDRNGMIHQLFMINNETVCIVQVLGNSYHYEIQTCI